MELVEESSYSITELLAIDKYWDSVSTERTIIHEARAEVAKKMKIKNIAICDIVELTGFTEEEISKL